MGHRVLFAKYKRKKGSDAEPSRATIWISICLAINLLTCRVSNSMIGLQAAALVGFDGLSSKKVGA